MYSVYFVGLAYLNLGNPEQRAAHAPDGTRGDGGVEVHHASVLIPAEHYDRDDWWPDEEGRELQLTREIRLQGERLGESVTSEVREFRLPKRATLTFACDEKKFDLSNVSQVVPHLHGIDPDFSLDLDGEIIADIPLPGGTLQAFQFGEAALVRWAITEHPDPITITARAGQETKTIWLKPGAGEASAEVVFSNTPDLLSGPGPRQDDDDGDDIVVSPDPDPGGNGHQHHAGNGHFMLYGKLNKGPNGAARFASPPIPDFSLLPVAPATHPYLRALVTQEQTPHGNCTPTCC